MSAVCIAPVTNIDSIPSPEFIAGVVVKALLVDMCSPSAHFIAIPVCVVSFVRSAGEKAPSAMAYVAAGVMAIFSIFSLSFACSASV